MRLRVLQGTVCVIATLGEHDSLWGIVFIMNARPDEIRGEGWEGTSLWEIVFIMNSRRDWVRGEGWEGTSRRHPSTVQATARREDILARGL